MRVLREEARRAEWAIQYGGVEPGGYMTGENFAVTCLLGVRHSHLDDNGYSIDQNLLNAPKPLEEQVRAGEGALAHGAQLAGDLPLRARRL